VGFDRTELPSGVRVVTERLPGQRTASIGIWVGVGSRDEADEAAGVTHFLEHLVFKGTGSRSALEIARAFDEVGGDVNAFTTKEYTCFHARILGDDVPGVFEILADIVQHAALKDADLESERSVILEEIAMHEDTPDDIIFDLFNEAMWAGQPLGRRVQGFERTLTAMPQQTVADFFRTHYASGDIVISASGAVDHDRIVELTGRYFQSAGMPRPRRPREPHPPVTGTLAVHEKDIEQVHLVYGARGIRRGDPRVWALAVMNSILGGGMSSRLFQEIREKRGLAYAISSGHHSYTDTGVFNIYAGCSANNVAEVMSITRDEIDRLRRDGATEDELRRAIGQVRGGLAVWLDEPSALMSHLGTGEICQEEILTLEEMIRRVEAVDMDSVHEVVREVLSGSPWTLVTLGPAMDLDVSRYVGAAA
jgi:predicted Zn-dependent peptidase